MGEVFRRHKLVRFNHTINIVAMDGERNAHEHVLGTLYDPACMITEEVRTLQGFEAKVLEFKVAVMVHGTVQDRGVALCGVVEFLRDDGSRLAVGRVDVMVKLVDNGRKSFLRIFVKRSNG